MLRALPDLYPTAVEIELRAATSWSDEEWSRVRARLESLGPSRAADVARLAAHRAALAGDHDKAPR